MTMEIILTIVVIAVALLFAGATAYLYFKEKTLNDIRADVYQLFLKAEHTYLESGTGKQKMDYVIQRARSLLPTWAQLFITEDVLRNVVQIWFDAVKDLLDDGKMNRSVKEE